MTPLKLTTVAAADTELSSLLTLAGNLTAVGAAQQALPILAHLKTWRPDRSDVRIAYVTGLAAAGRPLEAVDELIALRAFHPGDAGIEGLVQAQGQSVMEAFNAHLAANDLSAAEACASALARMSPLNTAILEAAMSCNKALARLDVAQGYARTLLALDPAHSAAMALMAEVSKAAGDRNAEVEQRVAVALAGRPDVEPLIRLRDLADAASLILCDPLTPRSEAQLAALLAAARSLEVGGEPGSEWAAWGDHYKLLIEALDMDLALAPPPKSRSAFKDEIADASGRPMTLAALKARSKGAQAVFFAAADEAYVELYARWYALSVLRYADTPFLVVIHVIGAAGRLDAIAAKVGVDDPRLIFTADAFDIEAVATKSVDAPPKGVAAKPLAHLQSARFLKLGALLDQLKTPVFVSDIDLILQRGVADLLARTQDDDLDLNENALTTSAGSRITANLLLVRPTAGGKSFTSVLARYLEAMLARPAVTRWIDQVALTLARQNMARNAPQVRIGYFDTESDINNVMYPSYQEHPFRFLSLYHGFDTSSLERVGLD